MAKKALAFSGPSNSGKTTLILRLVEKLKNKYKIAIIKHDPKDKAVFDIEGKDSQRFFASGADTLVVSPTRTTIFRHKECDMDEMIGMLSEFDLLFVEGLKHWDLPRISLFRERFDESYLSVSQAVALADGLQVGLLPDGIDKFGLDDIDGIARWVLKNAKEI
jgi:molybdopterin-guanine dinucleotide biosynthesis adapter protein